MFLYQLSWFKRRQLSFSKNWMFQSVRCLALTLEEKKQTNIQDLVRGVEFCQTRHGYCAVENVFFNSFVKLWSERHFTTWTSLGCFINTFQIKHTNCCQKTSGKKLSKICITEMAAVNALDKKLPLLFIGKAKKPKCFKIIKFLPCRYRNQYKSWKDGILFKEWVSDLDMKFDYGGKNVVLVIVNCPTHR